MITLHHLNHSRSQRVLWLLEEIGKPYDVVKYDRDAVTGADVQMSFVFEAGGSRGPMAQYPNRVAFMNRMQARPAYQRALKVGGPYRFAPPA